MNDFQSALPDLEKILDKIKTEAAKGNTLPEKLKPPVGATDTGTKAYSDGHREAQQLMQEVVKKLTTEDIGYLSGLGFTKPGDEENSRKEIQNSAVCAWDAAAAKYLKNQIGEGDAQKAKLQQRMKEFDNAIIKKGEEAVKPDE